MASVAQPLTWLGQERGNANKALHWTGIPLRSIPASDLSRYLVWPNMGRKEDIMKSISKMFKTIIGGVLLVTSVVSLVVSTSLAQAQTLFSEDFEGDLSQWVGKGSGLHHGIIVENPLRPGNHVLTFTALNAAGDIFGSEVSVTPGQKLVLSFEYLGIPTLGGNLGNLGGFIGFAEDTPGGHRWLAGTVLCCGGESDPVDRRW